jgi:hypothetical protein
MSTSHQLAVSPDVSQGQPPRQSGHVELWSYRQGWDVFLSPTEETPWRESPEVN